MKEINHHARVATEFLICMGTKIRKIHPQQKHTCLLLLSLKNRFRAGFECVFDDRL